MVLFECGNYTLNNGFDSGNLGRVELVKKHADGKAFNANIRNDLLPNENHTNLLCLHFSY